jgi:Calcineurin-like phosphoesterase
MKKMTAILLTVLALGGILNAQESRLIRFGLITDTHVCDKADQSPVITVNATARYFTGGVDKLEAFAKSMNKAGAAFIAELGDFTDNPADGSLSVEKKRSAALGFAETAETKLAIFKGPRYHVFGNHDTDQMGKSDYLAKISNSGVPPGATFYSWNISGVHFVVLDASFKADGSSYSGRPGEPGSGYSWDDANIPVGELNWLNVDLAANKLPTVILTHQLLNPMEQIDATFDPHHTVRNADNVRTILEKCGTVVAVFSGHYHDGGFQNINGIPYVVLQANTAYGSDVAYHNQYALVEIAQDGKNCKVTVDGYGLQKSYVLRAALK